MKRTIVALCLCLGACSGAQKVNNDGANKASGAVEPTADEIKECPCGNPDWSELPEGSDPAEPE